MSTPTFQRHGRIDVDVQDASLPTHVALDRHTVGPFLEYTIDCVFK